MGVLIKEFGELVGMLSESEFQKVDNATDLFSPYPSRRDPLADALARNASVAANKATNSQVGLPLLRSTSIARLYRTYVRSIN